MNNKEFIQVPVNIKVTNEDIANIFNKAFDEGGSLHWCCEIQGRYCSLPINEIIANNGGLLLQSMDGTTYELTREKFIFGVQLALPYLGTVINGIDLNVNSIDCDGADLIIQLAIFGELVYD